MVTQKQIWFCQLDPVRGSEQAGLRPVVVISGNAMNESLPITIVCPLTTKLKHLPGCVVVKKSKTNGLTADSEIIPFQIRSVSTDRLMRCLGEISDTELHAVFEGLRKALIL